MEKELMVITDRINHMRTHGASEETIVEACKMAAPKQARDIETLRTEGHSIESIMHALEGYEAENGVDEVEGYTFK